MEPIDIIYQLHRLGKSQAQLARELGISGGVINNVIHGRVTAHAVALHIAVLLGLEVGEIWPNQYEFKPRGPSCNRREATKAKSKEDVS